MLTLNVLVDDISVLPKKLPGDLLKVPAHQLVSRELPRHEYHGC
jgi:hypothetical protein